MNIWQRMCIAAGAVIIALMFLAFPVQSTRTIPNPAYNKNMPSGGLLNRPFNHEEYIDYKGTSFKALGVVAGTSAAVLLLGFLPKQKNENIKGALK